MRSIGTKSTTRDKLLKLASHLAVIFLSIIICLWMTSGAKAEVIKLKQISSAGKDAAAFSLEFDRELSKDQVAIKFDRNFIQLEMNDVSAYPAFTRSFDGGDIHKAFAYQYSPEIARVRFFVDGEATRLTDITDYQINGKELILSLRKSPSAIREVIRARASSVDRSGSKLTEEESDLLGELTKKSIPKRSKIGSDGVQADSKVVAQTNEHVSAQTAEAAEGDLFSNKNSKKTASIKQTAKSSSVDLGTGLGRLIFSLLIVLGIIGAITYGLKKGLFGRSFSPVKSLDQNIMQTLGTHPMGPNRSLMVVKIVDEIVVLGVTEHSINHVMNLNPDADFLFKKDKDEKEFSLGQFRNIISGKISNDEIDLEDKIEASSSSLQSARSTSSESSDIRNQIRKKISGFKPLT